MIEIYKNNLQQKSLAKLDACTKLCWVSVVSPDDEERLRISEWLNLPSEILEDSLDEFELPRVKIHENTLIIILRAVYRDGDAYRTTPFTIIMNDAFITTISTRSLDFVDDFISGKFEITTTQQSNFFIKVCLRIIENYQNYIAVNNRNVQQQKKNLNKIDKSDVLAMVETEELLNDLVASLTPTINIIKKILNYNHINMYKNDKILIDDLLVDGEQVLEMGNTAMRTIRNIRDGYTTVMTIKLNEIIEVLTYITAIFTVPMIIASFYGMNIKMPFSGHPYAFDIVLGLTMFFVLIAMLAFRAYKKRV